MHYRFQEDGINELHSIHQLRNRYNDTEPDLESYDPPIRYKVPAETDLYAMCALFCLDPETVWKMNAAYFGMRSDTIIRPGITLTLPGDAVNVPTEDIVPLQDETATVTAQNETATVTAQDETQTAPAPSADYPSTAPHADISREEALENIKADKYSSDPDLQYAVAKKLLIENELHPFLSKDDRQLLISLVAKSNEPTATDTKEETVTPAQAKYRKVTDPEMIKSAAYTITQNDGRVKNAFQFFSRIKEKIPEQAERDKELFTFFTGANERNPAITIDPALPYQGLTNADAVQQQQIKISGNLSYPLAVYTFMHELNHYMGMWYASKEARQENVRRANKETKAVKQINTTDDPAHGIYRDLNKAEQLSASDEGSTATVDTIMRQVAQTEEPLYPHPRTAEQRKIYKEWIERNTSPEGVPPSETDKQAKLHEIRLGLLYAAADTYSDWGMMVDEDAMKLYGSTGVELGSAFEKQAFGFYDPAKKNDDWAINAPGKFEEKYKGLINWYE